ncbi:MAG: hypothetical protein QXD08_09475 [Pyrobaculum sp.]
MPSFEDSLPPVAVRWTAEGKCEFYESCAVSHLLPKPVDIRTAAYAVAKALAMAKYVAEKCRDSPTWKVRTWELKMAVEDAITYLQWIWPWATRLFSPRGPP